MILLLLTIVWAAVLIPHHLANRAVSRPADSISAFRTQLSVLGRSAPRTGAGGAPGGARAVRRRRRRRVLGALAGVAVATFALGFMPGLSALHLVHVVVDVVLAGYVAWLIHLRSVAETRAATVRYLRPSRAPAGSTHPVLLLRHSGS